MTVEREERTGPHQGGGVEGDGVALIVEGEYAGTAIRAFEVGVGTVTYSGTEAEADFPAGMADAEVAVAQWGEGYGWGAEARVRLV